MRVLIVSLVYPPEHAPAGVMVAELAEELTQAGHEVTVLTGFPSHPAGRLFPGWKAGLSSRERTSGGFTVLRCIHSFVPRFGYVGKLWYHFTFALSFFVTGLFRCRCDAMVFQSTPAFCGPAAICLARLKRCRTFYWVQDIHPESGINAGMLKEGKCTRLMKAVDTWVCRRADVVAAPTEDMRRVLIARGLPPEHVRVQGHWLDEGRIQPASRQNRWREKQGLSPEMFVALYAGTVGYVSGAEVVVEAARLLADHQKVLFLFAGDGPLKASLQEKAKEYRLANIRFVSFQPEEDLNLMQAAADAGVVTLKPRSATTSIPSKMYGYTAAGRPVIASVEPGSPVARFIEEGGFGWVAPPADAKALAEAILVAASDCDECRRRGERARQFFVREFGRRAVAGRFARELETLQERHGLRR